MKSFLDSWGLTLATFLPMVGVAIMLVIPKAEEQLHKVVALVTSLAVGVMGVLLFTNFDYTASARYPQGSGDFQFVINKEWITFINSHYHLAPRRHLAPAGGPHHPGGAAVHHLLLEPLPGAAQPQGLPRSSS